MFSFARSVVTVTKITTLASISLLAACQRQEPPPAAMPAIPVSVYTVQKTDYPVQAELTGRTTPYLIAEIRPQVGGIIDKRLFTEGSEVKAGSKLYQINDEIFRANLQTAKANLARAQASADVLQSQRDRFAELVKINAVSQQEYDNTVAQTTQAFADLESAKANVNLAQINIRYASIEAPISGRIGKSSVTQGALVAPGQATPLATIQTLNPMYVDISVSVEELNQLKSMANVGHVGDSNGGFKVSLSSQDQRDLGLTGKVQFTDISVDPSTSSVMLRALVDNPKFDLLPGMFVRAKLDLGTQKGVFVIPQLAVSRNARGQATVLTIGADGTVTPKPIDTGIMSETNYVVLSGLEEGDKIITNNLLILRPGMSVVDESTLANNKSQ